MMGNIRYIWLIIFYILNNINEINTIIKLEFLYIQNKIFKIKQ